MSIALSSSPARIILLLLSLLAQPGCDNQSAELAFACTGPPLDGTKLTTANGAWEVNAGAVDPSSSGGNWITVKLETAADGDVVDGATINVTIDSEAAVAKTLPLSPAGSGIFASADSEPSEPGEWRVIVLIQVQDGAKESLEYCHVVPAL